MSITFTVPYAPVITVPCPFCQEEDVQFPEGNGRGGKCDKFCLGTMGASEAPEVNFSNSNAYGVLGIMGLDATQSAGLCDLATFRRGLMRALNRDRSDLVQDPSVLPGGHAGVRVVEGVAGLPTITRMGASVISQGNTDDQTVDRLQRLGGLAQWAQANGYTEITWG